MARHCARALSCIYLYMSVLDYMYTRHTLTEISACVNCVGVYDPHHKQDYVEHCVYTRDRGPLAWHGLAHVLDHIPQTLVGLSGSQGVVGLSGSRGVAASLACL